MILYVRQFLQQKAITNVQVISKLFSWRQMEDDSDRSWMDIGNKFHAVGLDMEKPRGPYRVSRQRGTLRSWRKHNCRHEWVKRCQHSDAHVCEVRRRCVTKALAGQRTQLEPDELLPQKPMEIVTHGAGDVVELPLAGNEYHRCV